MKTVYKVLSLGVLTGTFVFANATSSFAQDQDPKTELYTKFTACYKETDQAKRDACYAIGKEFLDKFESTPDEYTAFVRKQYDRYRADKETKDLYGRFNTAVKDPKTVNSDEAFASGKQIIAKTPELIDVPIVLASIGFDNAAAQTPNNKYNAEAINYAKQVIQQVESGKTSNNWGAYAYSYKNPQFPDGKANTLGWMNYTIGYIMFYRQGQKKDALPYLYKATQFNSGTKGNPEIYRTIGSYYVDEFIRLDNERVEKVKAAGNVDTEETKNILALQKGYADRAVEAYAKAYRVASADPKTDKAYGEGILKRVKELYAIRFDNKMDGFDAFLSSTATKPLTDPATAVVPVVEATPTTSAAPSTATKMTNTADATTAAPVRSSNASTTAAAAVKSTTPAAASTTKAAAKTPAKKPVAKKKGTR